MAEVVVLFARVAVVAVLEEAAGVLRGRPLVGPVSSVNRAGLRVFRLHSGAMIDNKDD